MRQRTFRPAILALGLGAILLSGDAMARQDADGMHVLTESGRTKEQAEKAFAEIPPIKFEPPGDRWARLPRAAAILGKGEGELRVVMLGDSIVMDTSQSRWDDVVQAMYPKCKIKKITCVRGSTGCWWYKDAGRVKKYVLAQNPDLVLIGGISHRDDVEAIRDVIRQIRAGSKCDVLLVTPVFGTVDPKDDKQWTFAIDPTGKDFRARLRQVADDEKAAFFDMTAPWGRYVRESGKELAWFKRDAIHANERGEQVIGRMLAAYFAPPVKG